MKKYSLLISISFYFIFCQSTKTLKTYEVNQIPENTIKIDGILEKSEWENAFVETDFSFPWLDTATPYTEFRALCSDSNFYFVFQVNDADIVINQDFENEMGVLSEDRVEIFMARDKDLKKYYGFEMDPLGRVMDYEASYYRQYNRSWTCADLQTVGTLRKTGYVVEGSIPIETLRSIGVLDDSNTIRAGVFRGEFHYGKNLDIIQHWISWVDLKTKTPDFHVPGAFGSFKLINKVNNLQ